ncbi:DUF4326 domain-containing protein [Mycobacterium sp. TY815]|uniref:DUF4326 domain-containing protein n=1 Tax=Mycobacterium sp. TY815 TaxID=3050581 RepID=UPI0027427E2D|nr:DUF4326 domain-containing protein [Mycobacterium sp. TY815]MDP7707479.1 DUF4326 domain-containing protein [Mycobacterium sp. TY815]
MENHGRDPRPRVHRCGEHAPGGSTAVSITSRFSNPFEVSDVPEQDRLGALVRYGVWLAAQRDLLKELRGLAGRDLACTCALDDVACHRNVLLDVANPPSGMTGGGRAMGLTVRRPWASLLLVAEELGGKTVENRTWSTDYRGPVLLYAGTRIDNVGISAAQHAGLDADWHTEQRGWLGASALIDVHAAINGCCQPWGQQQSRSATTVYHWVFSHPHRLADRTWGRGFVGLRPTSWAVLVRRSALAPFAPSASVPR